MQITFDNFTIRPIRMEDAENYYSLVDCNRKRITKYFPGIIAFSHNLTETREHIADRIAGVEDGKYMIMVITDDVAKKIIGVVQLKDIDFNALKREFGLFIDKEYEGKGIMTKSILYALEYCFKTLKLNKVFMRIAEENAASRRVAQKCGFELEGILRNDFKTYEGELINTFYYGRLR